MRIVIALIGGLVLLVVLVQLFVRTPPADLARRIRIAGGVALMLAGAGLVLLRQFALGLTVGVAGFMLLRREAGMRRSPQRGQTSRVRSAGLEMTLEHTTGEMDGRVLAGRHDGRLLSELTREQLLEVAEDFRGDAESLRLLESYLDRAHPGWRDDVQTDEAKRQRAAAAPGRMSKEEAYEILGLRPGASEADVREAHRRLMKQVHPDRGGSAALAAKINEAKERIVGRHR
jgi:hypothetical protein